MPKKVLIAIFLLVLWVPFLHLLFTQEPKVLTQMFAPSVPALVNNTYGAQVENGMVQNMAGKAELLHLKTSVELLTGKKEVNGVIVTGSRLLRQTSLPTNDAANEIAGRINQYVAARDKGNYYAMLLPTATEIYKDLIPASIPVQDEMGFINSFYTRLSSGITYLDALTPLSTNRAEPIFYNTDHRITSLGAFTVYNYNSKALGLVPTTMADYNIEHASDSYYGSLYKRTGYFTGTPDHINLYHYIQPDLIQRVVMKTVQDTIHTKTLYFRDNLSSSDQAAVYLNGSQPFVQITTASHTKQRLLIFADDNVGPLVQFLLPHYDLITVVNLSYSPEYYQPLINPVDYTDTLFFFSVQSLSNRDQFTNLEHI